MTFAIARSHVPASSPRPRPSARLSRRVSGRARKDLVRAVPLSLMLLLTSFAAAWPAAAQPQTPPPPAAPPATTSSQSGSSGTRGGSGSPLSLYLRGVPAGTATAETLSLTIVDAVQRALEHNLGTLLAEQRVSEAGGARWRALSDLLPDVRGRLSATRQKVNLAAFGFPLPAGIPSLVGPFNVYDARVFAAQSIFDLHAINSARAETHNVAAARFDYKNARDIVVLVSANSYAQALAASALVDSARAQLQTAEALHQQAVDLKQGGLVAGIDVLRAEVQVDTARQRVTATQADFDKSKLQLARIIGLPLGQSFTLADQMRMVAFPDITLEAALDRAYQSRSDYQAALARIEAAEANRRAITGEALPSVRVTADYGEIGLSPASAQGRLNVTGALNVPIFPGRRPRRRPGGCREGDGAPPADHDRHRRDRRGARGNCRVALADRRPRVDRRCADRRAGDADCAARRRHDRARRRERQPARRRGRGAHRAGSTRLSGRRRQSEGGARRRRSQRAGRA